MFFSSKFQGEGELERRGLRGACSQLFNRFEKAVEPLSLGAADTFCVSAGPDLQRGRVLPDLGAPAYINCRLYKDKRVVAGPIGFYFYSNSGVAAASFDTDGNPKVYIDNIEVVINEAVSRVLEQFYQRAAA
ncbi:MAG TPA: hypothetical protein VG753_02510 [Candidatus Paceibacterota bacterium]|nr:hypothetical protein [Candidatus Paceibacterota bacterium]